MDYRHVVQILVGIVLFFMFVNNAQAITLGEAVDATAFTWTTGGNANWFGETNTSYYGNDAAQSGLITHSQNTWIQSSTPAPGGTLRFYWKVSSETNYDFLEFFIDGVLQAGISGTVDWQQKTYTIPAGSHQIQWKYRKDGSVNAGSDAGWVDFVSFDLASTTPAPTIPAPTIRAPSITLGQAVDTTGLTWTTGGNANWFGQATTFYNGGDAAQSGLITHSQNTWVQTSVTGPGTLSFYWKVSSESGYDFLEFFIDGALQTGGISGTVDWQQKTYTIPAGSHTLQWKYRKDGSVNGGSDAGWLDKVVYTLTSTPTTPAPTTPIPSPSGLQFFNVQRIASSPESAYGELIYHPTYAPMYPGYELHLNTNVRITVSDIPNSNNYRLSYFAPIMVKGPGFTSVNSAAIAIFSGTTLIDTVSFQGVPVTSFLVALYDTFHSPTTGNLIENGNAKLMVPLDVIRSTGAPGTSLTEGRFVIQLVSSAPTSNWKIHAIAESSYEYMLDPTYRGTIGSPPPSMTGTFVQDEIITMNG